MTGKVLWEVLLAAATVSCGTAENGGSDRQIPSRMEAEKNGEQPTTAVAGTQGYVPERERASGMCAKLPMAPDGIVRLSKIVVYPEHLDKYMKHASEVGEISLRTEPGVLTMYALSDKENPCRITILETYASREAYEKHIASAHFRKYKQATRHMVKSLSLDDQTPLNPDNRISNYIL